MFLVSVFILSSGLDVDHFHGSSTSDAGYFKRRRLKRNKQACFARTLGSAKQSKDLRVVLRECAYSCEILAADTVVTLPTIAADHAQQPLASSRKVTLSPFFDVTVCGPSGLNLWTCQLSVSAVV